MRTRPDIRVTCVAFVLCESTDIQFRFMQRSIPTYTERSPALPPPPSPHTSTPTWVGGIYRRLCEDTFHAADDHACRTFPALRSPCCSHTRTHVRLQRFFGPKPLSINPLSTAK